MRVLIAYNPVSGRGFANKLGGEISAAILRAGCDVELLPTEAGDPRRWLLPRLKQIDRIVAVGGDGTLRSIASCLVDTNIPVYHAASGTENLFAKSMQMSNVPRKVVQAVLEGDVQRIDTATANGEFLLLMASVGFDAEVVADLAKNRGKSITHMSYLMPCVRKFLKFSPPKITITVDDKQIIENQKGWVVVANSLVYAQGLNPARNASLTDGLLDVVFLPIQSRCSLITWVLRVKRGVHLLHKSAIELRGRKIQINTSSPAYWQLDGDCPSENQTTQLNIVSHPNALTIITP
jgi:diacylglycerol kinase family enzyme